MPYKGQRRSQPASTRVRSKSPGLNAGAIARRLRLDPPPASSWTPEPGPTDLGPQAKAELAAIAKAAREQRGQQR